MGTALRALGTAHRHCAGYPARGSDGQTGDDGAAAGDAGAVAAGDRVGEPPGGPLGQRPERVPAFIRHGVVGRERDQFGLPDAFGVAALQVVPQRRPAGGHFVFGDGGGLEHPDRTGEGHPGAQAQVGVFGAGPPADLAEVLPEPAHGVEDVATDRHVARPNVADLRPLRGQAPVRPPDHPVELGGEPARFGPRPPGFEPPTGAEDRAPALVGEGRDEPLQPVLGGDGVVVQEGNELACGGGYAGVAGARGAPAEPVGHGHDVGHLGADAGQQLSVGVRDDDDLQRRSGLPANRANGVLQVVPALHREAADDDRDAAHRLTRPGRQLPACGKQPGPRRSGWQGSRHGSRRIPADR